MKLTKIELPYEVVAGFAKLSEAIGNPAEVESEHEHVETEILERGAARIAELEDALQSLCDEQNGPPLETRREQWQRAYDQSRALLRPTS
jgi:hypothetical protein